MSDNGQKSGQDLVPTKTDATPSLDGKSPAVIITPDGKGGINISVGATKSATPEEKKKMPRGSTVFRHA